ncbi:hypothetical protein [Streptosporangium roseum]|uniref:ABC transporter ATP-binding protein n=1 Tax=Streptosporangium roseum TaxID=2001 RepID=UPI003AFB803E
MVPPRAGSQSGWFVESGSVEEVLKAPKHPYTQALLSVLPAVPEAQVACYFAKRSVPTSA